MKQGQQTMKKKFMIYFAFIFLTGLPWLIAYAPGTLEPDAYSQLMEGLGVIGMTTHHPVPVTKLMSLCIKLGRAIFSSDAMGLFLYTLPQFLVQALCFAYMDVVIAKMRLPRVFQIAVLLFQTVFPLFQMWGFTFVKDTGYCISVVLFLSAYADLKMAEEGSRTFVQAFLMIFAAVLAVQFRNDGRYVILPILVLSFFAVKRCRKVYLTAFTAAFAGIFLIQGIYSPRQGIVSGSVREMLSIPMQQTAYYVKEHPQEVEAEEERILQEVFSVGTEGNFRVIGELYDADISDPVKSCFVLYPDGALLKEYFSVWYQQLLRHPGTYIKAFWNHVHGYFWPWKKFVYPTVNGYGYLEGIAWFKILDGEGVSGPLELSFWMKNQNLRHALETYTVFCSRCPVIRLLYFPGTYTWVLLGLSLWMAVKKKWREMLFLLPAFMILLICMASPVAACIRYMLPMMASMPLLIAQTCVICGGRQKQAVMSLDNPTGTM